MIMFSAVNWITQHWTVNKHTSPELECKLLQILSLILWKYCYSNNRAALWVWVSIVYNRMTTFVYGPHWVVGAHIEKDHFKKCKRATECSLYEDSRFSKQHFYFQHLLKLGPFISGYFESLKVKKISSPYSSILRLCFN